MTSQGRPFLLPRVRAIELLDVTNMTSQCNEYDITWRKERRTGRSNTAGGQVGRCVARGRSAVRAYRLAGRALGEICGTAAIQLEQRTACRRCGGVVEHGGRSVVNGRGHRACLVGTRVRVDVEWNAHDQGWITR